MEEEKIEGVCEADEKKCQCKKMKCLFRIAVLVLLLITTCLTMKISKDLDTLLNVTGIKAQAHAKAQNDFLISKKYDKGQSFSKALKADKPIITWFYVDWCGYCKRFAPTFDRLVKNKEIRDKYAIAFVNCEDEKNADIIKEYEIQGFPTVFVVNPKTGKKEMLDNSDFFIEGAEEILKGKLLKWNK